MEATQSFRLVGTTVILEISCDHDDGHNIIYWHDVLDAFPGAQYVKSGDTLVKRSRDTGIGRNKPQHIKHHPGVILDAVALSPIVIDPATSSTIYSKLSALSSRSNGLSRTFSASPVDGNIIGDLEIAPPTADRDIVKLEQRSAPDSAFEQRLISFLPPDIQPQVLASSAVYAWTVQAIQNGQVDRLHEQFIVCLQDLKDEMTKNNELASRNNELASRNNELASKNNALASRNNGLVCDVKELENKNNEMASRNNELASRISELASKNNELVSDVKDLTRKNNELATNNMEQANQSHHATEHTRRQARGDETAPGQDTRPAGTPSESCSSTHDPNLRVTRVPNSSPLCRSSTGYTGMEP